MRSVVGPSPSQVVGRSTVVLVGTAILARVMPVVVLGVIAGRRWWQQGDLPSGPDGGQWLALGRSLFGDGRSTTGAYPPLVPLAVHALERVDGPMLALRLVAVGSLLAVTVVVYAVARDGLGPGLAGSVAATIGLSSALTEPAAFGGYPQHVAFAAMLVAIWRLAHYLACGKRRDLAVTTLALVATALAHHVYFPLALLVATTICGVWAPTVRHRRRLPRRGLDAAGAGLVAIAAFLPTVIAFRAAGYAPPLTTAAGGVVDAFRYGTRESPWLWAAILGGGVLSLVATARRRSTTWQVAVALTVTCLPLFAATAQVRLLPPLLTGATLGVGLGLRALRERSRTPWGMLATVSAVALPIVLWPSADAAAVDYYRYYRVADASLVRAAAAVDALDPTGLVVVRHDRRGWPLGWWFEGLTDARIAVGSDPRWLGFPAERDRAALAGRFFDAPLTGARLTELAADTGVTLLVVRKWEWIGWQRWLDEREPAVAVVYDDDRYLILKLRGAYDRPRPTWRLNRHRRVGARPATPCPGRARPTCRRQPAALRVVEGQAGREAGGVANRPSPDAACSPRRGPDTGSGPR